MLAGLRDDGDVMQYDVVIVGGGPGGLSAALAFGRSRKRVLLCDAGPRRNAAAVHMHNFVSRDGIPPADFRRIAREQLTAYPRVELRDVPVGSITGGRGAFRVSVASEVVDARRVLICTGMIDELPPIPGFRELWGHAIFQCPYCHGWEVQDRPWAFLLRAIDDHFLPFALKLRGWTDDLVVFTNGLEIPPEARSRLETAGVRVETAPVARLVAQGDRLQAIELTTGASIAREVLFAHPPQRQVPLVTALDLALDEHGFVRVDPMMRVTSIPGIYAAGDLTSRAQGAIFAAAAGTQAAAAINVDLAMNVP